MPVPLILYWYNVKKITIVPAAILIIILIIIFIILTISLILTITFVITISLSFNVALTKSSGGAVAQSVERATPGEEVPSSILAVVAHSLLAGSVSL